MSFEEDFPSLKLCGYHIVGGNVMRLQSTGYLFSAGELQNYCIDKQKVKSALESLRMDFSDLGSSSNEYVWDKITIKMEELGLDK